MFDLSVPKLFMLVLVALFVLGPERLPAAATWLGQTIRQVKGFATGATEALRDEVGPEFDQLRQPLQDLRGPLQELRGLRDPKAAVMRHLFAEPGPSTNGPAAPAPPSAPPSIPAAGVSSAAEPVTPFDADAT